MKNKAGDQSLVKKANQRSIIEYLRKNGPHSKAQLSRRLKISKPTVAKNIDDLLDQKILYVHGEGQSSGGRKPILIGFNPKYRYVLSLEVNVNYPMIAIFDLEGKIVRKEKLSLKGNLKEELFLKKIYEKINEVMTHEAIDDELIGVITVSTPGIINEETGEIYANPQFKEWKKVNLIQELNKRFNKKIIVKNDISMAALGEKHYGIGKRYDNLIYISSTLGIGAGLILNGKLYEGRNKAAGEIGYFINEDQMNDEMNFENAYAVPKIIKRMKKNLGNATESQLYEMTQGHEEEITIEMIKECLDSGDPFVIESIEETAKAYAIAINNIATLLDLECVIIGGALVHLGVHFNHYIMDVLKRNCPIDVNVLFCGLKDNASLYGNYVIGNEYLTKHMIR